ncbi:MAG: hypothetical protein ACI9U2_003194 [Bradymonadia bacterium]|jgi:hypothetical protein
MDQPMRRRAERPTQANQFARPRRFGLAAERQPDLRWTAAGIKPTTVRQ